LNELLEVFSGEFGKFPLPAYLFLNISQGSVEECRYYLILARDLGYGDTKELMEVLEEVSKLLEAYSNSILDSES